jgi:hypothetical protein
MDPRGSRVPCDARAADGVIRGLGVGFLWGCFGPVTEAPSPRPSSSMLSSFRFGAFSMASFATFFGAYNGLLCMAESTFGSDSFVCPMLAGGAIGGVIGAGLPPPRLPNVLLCGSCTAFVSAVSARLLSKRRSQ